MRLVVTGKQGQVVSALRAKVDAGTEVLTVGRPELDLANPNEIQVRIAELKPDVVVNAAAYTAVDRAEVEPELALTINGAAAGEIALAAARCGVPVIQLSTDYVFDGRKASPYQEEDKTGPLNVYGRSKLAGETAVAAANPAHIILRTSWIYAVSGKNFVRTMLHCAETRPQVRVVNDQIGAPTSAEDMAFAIIQVARRLCQEPENGDLFGLFHLTARGATSWAGVAEAIFEWRRQRNHKTPELVPIPSTEYPTPAQRPANSRLDGSKIARVYGIQLPLWRSSLDRCLGQMLTEI
jgi:dTDP-4-dehydrorhamnose reductase